MKVWESRGDRAGQFARNLKADADVTARLSASDIDAMFDDFYHLKHVDAIFERVFGPDAA
jgi:adenylosuccinate lyase